MQETRKQIKHVNDQGITHGQTSLKTLGQGCQWPEIVLKNSLIMFLKIVHT